MSFLDHFHTAHFAQGRLNVNNELQGGFERVETGLRLTLAHRLSDAAIGEKWSPSYDLENRRIECSI
jgi:hypothetical protein